MARAGRSARRGAEAAEASQPEASEDRNGSQEAAEADEATEEDLEQLTERYTHAAEAANETQAANALSDADKESAISNLMRYILFKHCQQSGAPYTREELAAVLSKHSPGRRNLASFIIPMAQARFIEHFGLELREFSKERARRPAGGGLNANADPPAVKLYALRSTLPPAIRRDIVDKPADIPIRGFNLLVLALVHLSQNIQEAKLWALLEQMGVQKGEQHANLGSPEDVLQSMVKQKYLLKERENTPEGPVHLYRLGENAVDEVTKPQLDEFIANLFADGAV